MSSSDWWFLCDLMFGGKDDYGNNLDGLTKVPMLAAEDTVFIICALCGSQAGVLRLVDKLDSVFRGRCCSSLSPVFCFEISRREFQIESELHKNLLEMTAASSTAFASQTFLFSVCHSDISRVLRFHPCWVLPSSRHWCPSHLPHTVPLDM